MTYSFDAQLKQGQKGEQKVIEYFAADYEILPATDEQQRRGIDYIILSQTEKMSIEIKTDSRASQTGNAFIETVSVQVGDVCKKRGWVYTCQADVLLYYVPGDELIYFLKPEQLSARLPAWIMRYRKVNIPNSGYSTHGLLVPLSELEAASEYILSI